MKRKVVYARNPGVPHKNFILKKLYPKFSQKHAIVENLKQTSCKSIQGG